MGERAVEELQPSPKRRHEGHFEACPGDPAAGARWCLQLHMLLGKIRSDEWTHTADKQHAWSGRHSKRCSDPPRLLSSARDRDKGL